MKGKVLEFNELLKQDTLAAYRYREENLAALYREVTSALFKQIERLLTTI